VGRGGFDLEFGSVFMEQLGFMPKFNALVNLTTEHGQLSMDLILSQHTAMNGWFLLPKTRRAVQFDI
jgi:hypothetical protein